MQASTSTTLLAGLAEDNNPTAWRRFEAGYKPMLLSYARRVGLMDADAQDVVAETLATFLEAFRAGKYDRSRGRLKSWLGGIAANKIRKLRDRNRTTPLTGESLPTGDPDQFKHCAADELDAIFEREWQQERLFQAMQILRREIDPTVFQTFDLYAIKGWPVQKVISFLGVTRNVVYITKNRTIIRLREIVKELVATEE